MYIHEYIYIYIHSVVQQDDFLTNWMASERALGLHLELHPFDFKVPVCLGPAVGLPAPRYRSHKRLQVHFADQVELFVGPECTPTWNRYLLPLEASEPHHPQGQQLRPDRSEVPAVTFPGGLPPPDRDSRAQRGQPQLPSWIYDMWNIFVDQGATEMEEEGPIIYINSHFIHHHRHPLNIAARPLRFDQDWTSWIDDVRHVWEDLLDASQFDIFLVVPEPPYTIYQGTVATALVVQGQTPLRSAVLTSVVYGLSSHIRVHESAHSLPLNVPHSDLLSAAGAHSDGRVRIGHRHIPAHQDIHTSDGLGIRIFAPEPSHAVAAEPQEHDDTSFLGHVPMAPQRAVAAVDLPAVAAQSDQELEPGDSSEGSTSDTSSTDSTTGEWHEVVIYGEDGPWSSLQIPWDDSSQIYALVSAHIGIEETLIEYLHLVAQPPTDLQEQGLRALLLQLRLPAAVTCSSEDFLRIVLLDVEHYGATPFSWPSLKRTSKWLPAVVQRRSLLRVLGLEHACSPRPERCEVWLNEVLVDTQQREPIRLIHGDYVKVVVPSDEVPSDCMAIPDIDADSDVVLDYVMSLFQQTIEKSHRIMEADVRCAPTFANSAGEQAPQVPPQDLPPIELEQIQDAWNAVARATIATDHTLHVPFETWYLNGVDAPKCATSRRVALPADSNAWVDLIRRTWQDLIEPAWPVAIVLVHPQVQACEHGGHLLVLQHIHPLHRAILCTSYWHGEHTSQHDRFAHVLPRWLSQHRLYQFVDLAEPCRDQRFLCLTYVGAEAHDPALPLFPVTGIHIEVHFTPWADIDEVDLLQTRRLGLCSPSKCKPVSRGIDFPSAHAECESFQFNAQAPAFRPGQQFLELQHPFIRELYTFWDADAFAWQEEDRTTTVITYFVDHTDLFPFCPVGRQVHLFSDFTQWHRNLLAAWHDRIVMGRPIAFYLVKPAPPLLEPGVAAHIIIVQSPQPDLITTLGTVFEGSNQLHLTGRAAFTTFSTLHLDQVIQGLGLLNKCSGMVPTHQCSATCHGQHIMPSWIGAPMQGETGLSIVVRVTEINPAHPDGVSLLQLQAKMTSTAFEGERLTDSAVAHACRPPPLSERPYLYLADVIPDDAPDRADRQVAFEIIPMFATDTLPPFITLQPDAAQTDFATALAQWGYVETFHVDLDSKIVLCFGKLIGPYLTAYVPLHYDGPSSVYWQVHPEPLSESQHMRFLYQCGVTKAVLTATLQLSSKLSVLHYTNVVAMSAPRPQRMTQRTPLPPPQPLQKDFSCPFQSDKPMQTGSLCRIELGVGLADLTDFFQSANDLLHQDLQGFDLLNFARLPLQHAAYRNLRIIMIVC